MNGPDPVSSRERTRAQLVEVPAHLLATAGPDAVTTRSVALAAGVQAPTIYRLFGDKSGLLDAVVEHIQAAGTGVVFTLIDQAGDERDDTLADTAWESVCVTILTDASSAAITGPAAAAVTLCAARPDLTALTSAERALLGDWLDRIAESQHVPHLTPGRPRLKRT